jgi:hypothetical protein
MKKLYLPVEWITENGPIHIDKNEERRSFRRYLMTNIGPVAYIEPHVCIFEKYNDNFNKDGAEFSWSIVWLLNGIVKHDGTVYANRRLIDVESILLNKLIDDEDKTS